MKHRLLFVILLACTALRASAYDLPFTLPTVENWKPAKGECTLSLATCTVSAAAEELNFCANHLLAVRHNPTPLAKAKKAKDGAVHYMLVNDKTLGQEGYILTISPKRIVVQANTPQGALWGTNTLLQLTTRTAALPCGEIRDVPAYALRGFMIDCGRKYIPLDYLYNLVDVMSFYKMNTLQVHLNDNGFKKYHHDRWDETYAGFRIESELFPGLTSIDGFYKKDEFRQFIRYAAKRGVDIIPEFDAPAHSLAFTKYRPSLACEEYGADHLDLRNPEVIPFLDSIYMEYLGGPDPVFCGPRVHIGTDEYSNRDPEVVELFRALTDHLIRTVESYGKQACVWGALTHAKGKTPVKADGVIMDMWYNGYANPTDMKAEGYQMVSIPDGYVYIVPEAGYYYNYLNCQYLYEHWTPAVIGNQTFPERDPQILGGMFAVWNDVSGNGISVSDIHHRAVPAIQVIAEKTWHAVNDTVGYAQWDKERSRIHLADYELGNTQDSFRTTFLRPNRNLSNDEKERQMGYGYEAWGDKGYEVAFNITWADEKEGTVLTESSRAKFYLSDPIRGMLGYSRDGYLFTFDYRGLPGKKEHIAIRGNNRETSLWVNGKLVQTLGYNQLLAADKTPYNQIRTLAFPMTKAGDFRSTITDFVAKRLQ